MSLGPRQSSFLGVLLVVGVLASACSVATRDKKVGAGLAAGTALTGAAIYRATTGGCWAQCTHGRICDRKSGTCVEVARAPAGTSAPSWVAPPADADAKWWEKDPACPSGAELDRDSEQRVIRCALKDGIAEGRVTFFHGNGRKQMEGWSCGGKPCRVWTHWDEDGRVSKVEDLGAPVAAPAPAPAPAACAAVARPPTYDVFFDTTEKPGQSGSELVARVRAPAAKLRLEVWSSPAPTSCESRIEGDALTFYCITDEGDLKGRVSIVAEELVIETSTGLPMLPQPAPLIPSEPSPPAPPSPRTERRTTAKVPCGTRLRFHPSKRTHGMGSP